ncbi:MAG: hypothetical protein ACE5OZ_10680 [Candidatus Heimdallarchaeota archaeon]
MAHFMKGLGAGLGGFALWVVASILAAVSAYDAETNTTGDYNPFFYLLMIIGFVIMIGGPVYYWILHGFIHKEPLAPPMGYQQQAPPPGYQQQAPPPGYQQQAPPQAGSKFCTSCGGAVDPAGKFCDKCGTAIT